jgi:hypothetical protein
MLLLELCIIGCQILYVQSPVTVHKGTKSLCDIQWKKSDFEKIMQYTFLKDQNSLIVDVFYLFNGVLSSSD